MPLPDTNTDTTPEADAAARVDALLKRLMFQQMSVTQEQLAQLGFVGVPGQIDQNETSWMELVLVKLVRMSFDGNVKAIQEILDRVAGKPTQHVKTESENNTYVHFLMGLAQEEAPMHPRLQAIDPIVGELPPIVGELPPIVGEQPTVSEPWESDPEQDTDYFDDEEL